MMYKVLSIKSNYYVFYFYIILILFPINVYAADILECEYKTRSGVTIKTNDYNKIPRIYRDDAVCVPINQDSNLASVDEIDLKRQERNDVVRTSLGDVNLKWAKDVKPLLGKNPQRVIANAMGVVSKVISSTPFSQKLNLENMKWNIVFMGKDIPSSQIPNYLIDNCHPGWMVPPSDIYISAYNVYKGCNGSAASSNPDMELEQVLLHELGHVVEFKLLENRNIFDRKRSEGFATWFSIYASNYSSISNREKLLAFYKNLAKTAIESSPNSFNFKGSAYDYARSSMYFYIIEQKQGISGIIKLYNKILGGSGFVEAVSSMLNTTPERLESKLNL